MAILITMKAKWYQREIANILVRTISKERPESETIKIAGRMACFFPIS
ncbi:hypothetical protein NBG4_230027 [Candidatus Sulfobium mesophilum]|uniref:Uncharacterized protein n=1 Tax=Candidatus Sulfobium mesophilum TaxID=2016548 RepID=A0A2U3QGA9_9BACT|nr:hypothetical protein NBG4_230027 [Candidatus Sulfobium mesophilum]